MNTPIHIRSNSYPVLPRTRNKTIYSITINTFNISLQVFSIIDLFSVFVLNQFSKYYVLFLSISFLFGIRSWLQLKTNKIIQSTFMTYLMLKTSIAIIINICYLMDSESILIIVIRKQSCFQLSYYSLSNLFFFLFDCIYLIVGMLFTQKLDHTFFCIN